MAPDTANARAKAWVAVVHTHGTKGEDATVLSVLLLLVTVVSSEMPPALASLPATNVTTRE